MNPWEVVKPCNEPKDYVAQHKETKGTHLATIPPSTSEGFKPMTQDLIPIVAKTIAVAPKHRPVNA